MLIGADAETRQIFLYCLSEAAKKHKIALFFVVLMANHYHALARDLLGLYPAFMRDLNSWFAKAMNCKLRRSDKFWSGRPHQPLVPARRRRRRRAPAIPDGEPAQGQPGVPPEGLSALHHPPRGHWSRHRDQAPGLQILQEPQPLASDDDRCGSRSPRSTRI